MTHQVEEKKWMRYCLNIIINEAGKVLSILHKSIANTHSLQVPMDYLHISILYLFIIKTSIVDQSRN